MAAQQMTPQANKSSSPLPLPDAAEDLVAILETQLGAFRSIYDITTRIQKQFGQADASVALKEGIQKRAAHLERAQDYAGKLKDLKLQWEAQNDRSASGHDSRIQQLINECQEVIGKIVETDNALHRTASDRQKAIRAELAQNHRRRQPLAAYFATPALSECYSVPISGKNVHFPEA